MERGEYSGLQRPYEDNNLFMVSEFKIISGEQRITDSTNEFGENSMFNDENVYSQRSTKIQETLHNIEQVIENHYRRTMELDSKYNSNGIIITADQTVVIAAAGRIPYPYNSVNMTTQDGEDDGNYDESPIKYQLQSNFKQQNNEL